MTLDIMSDQVRHTVNRAAEEIRRMYGHYIDVDDVRQEMYLALVKNPALLDLNTGLLRRRLKDTGVDYARREKAHRTGYDPRDEYFYSIHTLLRLLPDAFDQYAVSPRTGGEGEGGMPPARGERTYQEWETQVADVRRALDRVGYADFSLLRQLVKGDRDTNDTMVQSALRNLQARLGGPR